MSTWCSWIDCVGGQPRQHIKIEYSYNANGAVAWKDTWDTHGSANRGVWTELETVEYGYNLQGRLSSVTTMNLDAGYPVFVSTYYRYDPEGNRVEKIVDDYENPVVTTKYLVDEHNPTGYTQVLVETTGANKTAYIIGDDVLSQATGNAANAPKYLLYDGHGSTRQLTNASGTVIAGESYSYDSYGVLLGGERATQTSLLYTGEQYDTSADMYYLRARYYDPLNGRFNQVDPYAGSPQDPQSLHKYLYAHGNPVNGIDPSGQSFAGAGFLAELNVVMLIGALVIATLAYTVLSPTWRHASEQVFVGMIRELRDLAISGESAAIAAYNAVVGNTQIVTKAIDDVAKALRKTVKELSKMKLFPIIKSLTPDIFNFNVAALATHPYWLQLNYVGAGPAGDIIEARNRSVVEVRWGCLRATAPPGYELDEFPYARTNEGGYGAMAQMVDWKQHRLQGGLFGTFCRCTMRGTPGPFFVVPIPL